MFNNILIIGHSNIGDVCCDLVVVNPLHREFPKAKITFLTSSRSKNIAEGYKGLQRVVTFDKHAKDKGLKGSVRFMAALAKERFDLLIILKSSLRYMVLGIPCVWNVRKYFGFASLPKRVHSIDVYLEFLRSHAIDAQEAIFDFGLDDEDKKFCDAFLAKEGIRAQDKVVGILPMAAWSIKSWPIDKWNELAGILKSQYGVKVIGFSKSDKSQFSQEVLKNISGEIIPANKTTLKQAMALISRCNLFIGPDSGLLHLASCIGVGAIGLYGPTPPDFIYPYFHRQDIIISKKKSDCMPCYPGFKSFPCKGKFWFGACMEAISVEDVLESVKKKLDL
ncbi:glycosyltransferase family 9 protein [Thermoproteota archaeon]